MKYRLLYLFLFLSTFGFAQISFEVLTNAESILQGSTFQLTFLLKNAEGTNFRAPDFSPFQIISGPSRSMQTTIINGAMSSSIGYVYTLSGNRTGYFTIPSASIVVNGKSLHTRPVRINVVKATANASSSADVFIKASIEKDEIYFAEQCMLTYKLFTRVSIDGIELVSKPMLDEFQEHSVNLLNNPTQREIHEGKEYTTKILSKSVLFPVKSGIFTIEPAVFRIIKGDDDPWGMGMPSLFRSQIENIVSNELLIKVKELPHPQPKNFSGAVGEMFIQINPLNASYNLHDVIHLGINLQGDANFNIIKSEFIQVDSSFEISNSKTGDIIKVTDEPRMTKTRKYDYFIVPKVSGDFIIKSNFVFFSPEQGKYINLEDSFGIQITHSDVSPGNEENEIADIKHHVELHHKIPRLIEDYRTWLSLCLPFGLLLFAVLKPKARKLINASKSIGKIETDSAQEDLKVQIIEKLILQKFYKMYPQNNHGESMMEIKQILQETKNSDSKADKFLQIILQLETIKYSSMDSSNLLNSLKENIAEL